jgi:spermidine synthase
MSALPRLPYYAVFFVAGIPALIYQVVWQRVLTLYFGVDIYSTSVTVSTFMLGLGFGSLLGGALADRWQRPDLAYAGCEAWLAVCGAASLPLFHWAGTSLAGATLLQTALAVSALLLVPTFFMGMTLPLMMRTLLRGDGSAQGRELAWLYGANTLGAAAGALLTSYFVIGWIGLTYATWLAATLNLLLATAVLWLGRKRQQEVETPPAAAAGASVASEPVSLAQLSQGRVLTLAFLSGTIAFGYELVWYRLIQLLLHGTAYVFGTILGVLLTFMGIGALLSRRTIDRPQPGRRFANAQLLMAVYTLLVLTLLGRGGHLPGLRHLIAASSFISFHPAPALASGDLSLVSIYSLLDTLFWPALVLGVPALAMGYGFPNLIRAAPAAAERVGRSLGSVYCANIIGSTLGSLLVGFVLVEHLGSERTVLVLLALNLGCAALAGAFASNTVRQRWLVAAVALAGALLFPGRGELLRSLHFSAFPGVEYFGREDKTGIVALRRQHEVIAFDEERSLLGEQRLYIDGARHGRLAEGDEDPADTDLQVALSAHPHPRRVLSIGLGDGRMVAAALEDAGVEEVLVIELSSGLREVLARTSVGQLLETSSKLRYENDDGRRWLLAHPEARFDLIMAWPLHAAHAFSGNLYSEEFFQLIRAHLPKDGLFFTRTTDAFSTARTLAGVFPHLVRVGPISYVGSAAPLEFSAARAARPVSTLARSLKADRAAILALAGEAPIVRDLWPRTEYYLTYPWAAQLDGHSGKPVKAATAPSSDLTALIVP